MNPIPPRNEAHRLRELATAGRTVKQQEEIARLKPMYQEILKQAEIHAARGCSYITFQAATQLPSTKEGWAKLVDMFTAAGFDVDYEYNVHITLIWDQVDKLPWERKRLQST